MNAYTAAYNFVKKTMGSYYWDAITYIDLATATTAESGVHWDTMTIGELVDEIAQQAVA